MSQITASAARARDNLCRCLRSGLHERGFIEVNTPILMRPLPSTSGHRLAIGSSEFELRPCMELKLRSAIAAGLPAVFELGPCFRPTDLPDQFRHPEFYLLELFQAKLDYSGLLTLTRDILAQAVGIPDLQFEQVDVSAWFEAQDIPIHRGSDAIRDALIARDLVPSEFSTRPAFHAVNHVIGERLEIGRGTRQRPALLHSYPVCTVCLARRVPDRPSVIERFEVFVDGLEIAHGFVDEMDVDSVLDRMRENGPQFTDERFLQLLRGQQLAESAGVGFGIERLLVAFGHGESVAELVHENQFLDG